ncbi:hypothetical protein M407DRAFT_31860 [Tulasnella calospora MUT 4182]|uniref:Uncharacterized protein n=1 Tax=Tulasnella calospora MUT 4182 TaxID=1051891 RepID=A0A0C3KAP7_9AGAM|nr:hypothetical protein M407DRAFT_31860 [Tulasnella calospora MUT 4182]
MSFLWRAVSALRQAIRTLVSKTRRTAKAIVRGLSSAVQTAWNYTTEVIENAATASTTAVVEVANIITDTARNGYGVLRNTLRETQRFIIDTTRKVVKTFRAAWNWWNTKVPRWVRLTVYGVVIGATLGLVLYLVLGFGPAGIVAGTPAAAMHSSIGNVAAGTWFATMQSLGATGKLAWIMPTAGAVLGALLAHFF